MTEQEYEKKMMAKMDEMYDRIASEAIDLQSEPEPVAWIHRFIEGGISIGKKPVDLDKHPDRWMPVYADPTPCQTCEALARTVMMDQTSHDTSQQRKEWQGLTDEEMEEVAKSVGYNPLVMTVYEYRVAVQKATEAKLKEKNYGR